MLERAMYVKAVRIDDTQDETLRVLNAMFGDYRDFAHTVSPQKLAAQLDISEGAVRYQIKKLERLGYIHSVEPGGYKPTEKMLFLKI